LQTWISMGGGQTKILIKKNVSMVWTSCNRIWTIGRVPKYQTLETEVNDILQSPTFYNYVSVDSLLTCGKYY
jgi:hypothetical protein